MTAKPIILTNGASTGIGSRYDGTVSLVVDGLEVIKLDPRSDDYAGTVHEMAAAKDLADACEMAVEQISDLLSDGRTDYGMYEAWMAAEKALKKAGRL